MHLKSSRNWRNPTRNDLGAVVSYLGILKSNIIHVYEIKFTIMNTLLKVLFTALLMSTTYGLLSAQKAEKFTVNGNEYFGTKAIPAEITGKYWYEKDKEPIVEILKDGTGYFQVHDVKAYPVEYWIETDAAGKIQMRKSETNGNYQVVLILQYGSNGESGWRGNKTGTYDRIDVTMAFDQGYAIVMGERFRKL